MVTVWVAVLLFAPSESLTWTETALEAGPSGDEQTKLPPEAVVVVEPTWLPLRPQLTATTLKGSTPGSETVNEKVCWVPSLTERSLPADRTTVGATLATVTASVWTGPGSPAESVALAG